MSKTLDVGIRITADGKILAAEARAAKDAIGGIGDATRKAAADSSAYAEQTTRALDIVRSGVKGLAAGLAGLSFASLAKEAAGLSQRYAELGIVLDVVGRNQGHAREEVDSITKAIQKQGISMIESRQVMATMITSNIDLAKATQLARLAQDAAVVGQMNSSEALKAMIHGISSAQIEVLRGIGINVNFEQSYAKLAKQMGVTQDALTEQEKMQARVNVVLAEAPKLAGVYEASMENAGKQMRSTERIVEDLKVKLGSVFDDASRTAVSAYSAELKILNDRVDFLAASGQLKSWGRDIAMTFAQVADVARNATNIVGGLISTAVANVDNLLKGDFRAIFESARQGGVNLRMQLEDANHYQDALEKRFIVEDMLTEKVGRNNNVEQKRTEVTAAATEEVKKQITEYDRLLNSIVEKTAINNAEVASTAKLTESGKIRIDVDTKVASGILKLNAQQKNTIDLSLQELSVSEKLLANKQFARQQSEALANLGNNQTNQLRQQLDEVRAHNALIGKTREEIVAMAGAKERETAAVIRSAAVYAGDMHDAYMRYANDLETTGNLQQQLMQEQEVQRYAQAWNQTWSSIEQTGKSAFIQFAAHGKSAMQSIGDAIKTSLLDLLYQLTIRKWIINIGTSLESTFINNAVASAAGGSGGGLGNIISGGSNLLSNGLNIRSLIGRGASALGFASFGEGASGAASAGVFGAGGLNYLGGAGTALGAGAEFGSAASLGAGLSSGLAAAAGPAMIAFIATQGLKMLAGNKRLGGGFGNVMNAIGDIPVIGDMLPIIPLINGLFGRGPLKQKETQLTGEVGSGGLLDGYLTANFKAKGALISGSKHDFAGVNLLTGTAETDNGKLQGVADGMAKYALQVAQQINESVGSVNTSLRGLGDTLGISTKPLDDYRHSINLISESGKALTDEQIAQEISTISDEMVKSLLPTVDQFAKSGESSIQTITRLGAEFNALVSGAELLLGKSSADAKAMISGGTYQGRTAFVDAAGGLDALNQKVSFFADNFLTDAQRLAPVQEQLNDGLKQLGLSSDLTRDQYRDLVQSFGNVNGISEETLQSLLNLAPAFIQVRNASDQLTAAAKQQAEADRQRLISQAGAAFSELQKSVETERKTITGNYNTALDAVNARIQSVTDSISKLKTLSDALKATVSQLRPLTYEQARQQISTALATARAGGALPDADSLREALSAVGKGPSGFAGSFEYARERAKAANLVGNLGSIADTRLSDQENLLAALQDQQKTLQDGFKSETERLDGLLAQGQGLVDVLSGLNTSIQTLAAAIGGLNSVSIAAGNGSVIDAGSFGNPNISNSEIIDYFKAPHTAAEIARDAGKYGVTSQQIIATGRFTQAEADQFFASNPGIKRFAKGGFHSGGLRIVGENGPELESTGPSRITSNNDLAQLLSNDDVVEQLKILSGKLDKNTEYNRLVLNKLDAVTKGGTALRTKAA